MDRVAPLLPGSQNKNPTTNMKALLNTLDSTDNVPEVDKYYVFIYKAKTRGIMYDAHPFVVVTGVFPWGFSGYNFHWEQPRRYSWNEVVSNLYVVTDEELTSVSNYPIANIKSS